MSQLSLKQFLKYRLFLRKSCRTQNLTIKNKLLIICFLTSFTSKAYLLSQLFFLETKKNNWFKFDIYSNIHFLNNKKCIFTFNSFMELVYFIFLTKSLTLIPYVFFPLKILKGNSKLELPLSIFNLITKSILLNGFILFLFWKQFILGLYSLLVNLILIKI